MLPVFVQPRASRASAPDPSALVALPADLLPGGAARVRLEATSRVALRVEGPYDPLGDALESSAAMRERMAVGLALPAVARWRRARMLAAALAALPLLVLVEIDREEAMIDMRGAAHQMIVDVVLAVVVALDLARKVPRHVLATSIILFAAAARYALLLSRACGRAHWVIWALPFLAIAAGGSVALRGPRRARIVREALDALGVREDDVRAARSASRPPWRLVLLACAAAVGLPVVLFAARAAGLVPWLQAVLFAGYAAIVPTAIERFVERRVWFLRPSPWRLVLAVLAGFAFTTAIVDGARDTLGASTYAVECAGPPSLAAHARRAREAERSEVTRAVREPSSWMFFVMTVVVVPLVEERVYRSLLQRLLVRRWGAARGMTAAAVVFGLAHFGVYKLAVYQTTLLGIGFGLAYLDGGVLAAVIVHALWNLHSLT